jgi:hypothetical protein
MAKPHDILDCDGTCSNPFHDTTSIQLAHAESRGLGWGDVAYEWELEELSRETPAQKHAKLVAREKREAQAKIDAEASRMFNYMNSIEQKMGCKENRGRDKIQRPCKNLYYTPGRDGVMQNNVCSECWAHEYTCPKTGERIVARKDRECAYLHPGQPGWLKEWNTNRHYAAPGAAPAAPNRFSSLASSSRHGDSRHSASRKVRNH